MELILYFRTLLPPSKLRHGLSKLFRLFGSFFLGIGGKRKLPREKCWSFLKKNSLSALGHLYYFTSCFQPQSDPSQRITTLNKPIYILCFNIKFIKNQLLLTVTLHFIFKFVASRVQNNICGPLWCLFCWA